MIGPLEKKPTVRIAGYLEKKGKMRVVVSRWKRWWFVLQGHLLLYYKSKIEYLNLSPCRGSLNMGLAASVQPGKGLELTVLTRSQSVTLRASNRAEHEQWLQSLLDAMALPNSVNTLRSRPVMRFRYGNQEYHENLIRQIKTFNYPSFITGVNETTKSNPGSVNTSCASSNASGINKVQSEKCLLRRVFSDSRALLQRPCKRNSDRLSKIGFSDSSIPVSMLIGQISKAESSEKCHSLQELRESLCVHEEIARMENSVEPKRVILNGKKESKLLSSNSIKIELNLEDIDTKSSETVSEQKIGNITITLDGCAIYGSRDCGNGTFNSTAINKCSNNNLVDSKRLSTQLNGSKEAKSDSNLAVIRRSQIYSLSCENVQALDRSIGPTYQDTSAKVEAQQKENERKSCQKTNKKRSNSILSRFMESKEDTESGNFDRMGTLRKKLSFLRKIWNKGEKKREEEEEDNLSNEYESIPVVTELSSPDVDKAENILLSLGGHEVCGPEPEPPPDYDTSLPEELEIRPVLPPKLRRPKSIPLYDVPKNNKPVIQEEDKPPPLPVKIRKRVLITISQDTSTIEHKDIPLNSETDFASCTYPVCNKTKVDNLDTLLAQLSDVNTLVVQQIDSCESRICDDRQKLALEADYDVPRPHISLLGYLNSQNAGSDSLTATHFLCSTPLVELDSLDPVMNRLDAEMTPDSLECDSPWSLTHATFPSNTSLSDSMPQHFFANEDKLFPDSLSS